MFLLEMQ